MDLFNLIRAPNHTKVKTGSRPRAPHEVPLLTLTAFRVIEMDDPAATKDSSGVPSTIERSPLDFSLEAGASAQGTVAPEIPPSEDVPVSDVPEVGQAEETVATDPPAAPESRKRGRDETDFNAPPKSLRRDHADPRPLGSSRGVKSLAVIQLGLTSTVFMPEDAPTGVSDWGPLSVADPPSRPPADVAQSSQGTAATGYPESENDSPAEVGSSKSVYRPEWGVTNGSLLDTPEACQDMVAMGSQLRLRFEQEAKLLRKSVAQKAAEDRSAGLSQELENMRAQFSDLQVSNECLSHQVATLQQQVSGEEKLKAAFEEFKRQQDERVKQRCVEMDARLDALSIDFDEELYPHMLTAITGRRWVTGRGLRLAVMKCGESLELRQAFADAVSAGIAKGLSKGLRHGLEHGQAQLSLESIEAYDPEAKAKFFVALQALKDLKYPLVDQLESLKDASMDVIMAALYLKSDIGDDAPQDIRDLRPSSSQLTILVYPEKKKCCILCRTHRVGSAHHARSDGVLVSAPTVVPKGLALLLADATTQTELEDDT
nr:hypothetical protein [Tanacetum cinerariifolium]